MGGGWGVYCPWYPYLPKTVEIYKQDDRDMTNDKMIMYIFENILQY